MTNQPDNDPPAQDVDARADEDDGPGWMPAIMAATLLLGIAGFICCGVSTWVLFQKRSELAVRTLRGFYIPELEQSYLEPDEKEAVLKRIELFAADLERGKYEDWQAAGVLQRLQRLPVVQWGELNAIEGFIEASDQDEQQKRESIRQLSRLRQAVELGKATSFDFEDVLKSVLVGDERLPSGRRLVQPLTQPAVNDVVKRAKKMADRSQVPDEMFDADIDSIVRREIEAGLGEGGF